jgi:immune inhibitor A
MRRLFAVGVTALLVLALAAVVGASTAGAGGAAPPSDSGPKAGPHDLPSPLSDKQRALRAKALEMQLTGKIPKGAKVGQVAKGQYVQLAREGEDSIWTVLGEFGESTSTTYGGAAGPVRNQIPAPDRSTDNTTIWSPDFSADYYRDLLFGSGNSMRSWYIENSSGRYAVNGEVTDWVRVPYNESYYGSDYCGDIVCPRTWLFLRDQLTAWYNAQKAAGKTDAAISAELAKYDKWDRYDYDGDGNFNEPDGYIDHFQSIHAGVGEETGGGAQGQDAIWSHRWYAFYNLIGSAGPAYNPAGGIKIGNTDFWIGDYTIEPENGGVGVFSHEFGHDLGLPDEYDTSGNTGGAENGTGFWTNWSSGSYGNNGDPAEGIGDRPFHASAWDKLVLGWLNYDLTVPGDKKKEVKLGPAEANTKQAQAEIVVLPDKMVPANVGDPHAGSKMYYSGTGNLLDTTMTRSVTLPSGAVQLSAYIRTNIETDFDYAYLTVNGTSVSTSQSTSTNPNGGNLGFGITGVRAGWTALTADLSSYAGQTVTLGFRYKTDPAQQGQPGGAGVPGFQVDDIAITGQPADGAETAAGWAFAPATGGFHATGATDIQPHFNAYVVENRQYLGYDAGLKTGPYNFGGTVGPNWAERFPYQDGMLVWYWDDSQGDNNVGDHPGSGLILPVDAHPAPLHWANGAVMRPRIQSFDATFSLAPTDAFTIHNAAVGVNVPSQPGVSTFDDSKSYWVSSDPGDAANNGRYQASWNSVKVPNTGTQIRIQSMTPGGFMQIQVTPPK